jgi:hypothetical protein
MIQEGLIGHDCCCCDTKLLGSCFFLLWVRGLQAIDSSKIFGSLVDDLLEVWTIGKCHICIESGYCPLV